MKIVIMLFLILTLYANNEDAKKRNIKPIVPQLQENKVMPKEEVKIQHTHYEAPNYAKLYKNTPQIVLPKQHIYGITQLSHFRDNPNSILVQASSGSFAIPLQDFQSAEYLFFTKELENIATNLGIYQLKK